MPGPKQDARGNVDEEATSLGKATGETRADFEQGTLVKKVRLLESPTAYMWPGEDTGMP